MATTQQALVQHVYANIGEQVRNLKNLTFSSHPTNAKKVVEDVTQLDTDGICAVKIECALISLQLELLDKLFVGKDFRDLGLEDIAREWAFIIEDL